MRGLQRFFKEDQEAGDARRQPDRDHRDGDLTQGLVARIVARIVAGIIAGIVAAEGYPFTSHGDPLLLGLADRLTQNCRNAEGNHGQQIQAYVTLCWLKEWIGVATKLDDLHRVRDEDTGRGKQSKNDQAATQQVIQAIHDASLDRHSYVAAVGGGAVLDVIGYAAAMAHRGIRLIRIATYE